MSIPRPKQSTRNPAVSMLLALLLGSFALPAGADEDCVDFKWDVSKERILFAGAPADLTAGYDRASAPLIVPNRLYRLQLQTQDTVAFSVPPGKPLTGTQSFAGLATLKVAVPGSYRVAVDVPFGSMSQRMGSCCAPRTIRDSTRAAHPTRSSCSTSPARSPSLCSSATRRWTRSCSR